MLPTGRVIAGEFRDLSHRSGQVLTPGLILMCQLKSRQKTFVDDLLTFAVFAYPLLIGSP